MSVRAASNVKEGSFWHAVHFWPFRNVDGATPRISVLRLHQRRYSGREHGFLRAEEGARRHSFWETRESRIAIHAQKEHVRELPRRFVLESQGVARVRFHSSHHV